MSDRIKDALGAKDDLEALRVIEDTNNFLTSLKEVTGRDTYTANLSSIKGVFGFLREVTAAVVSPEEHADGAASPSLDKLLGTVLAWKQGYGKVEGLEKENTELKEKVRVDAVNRMIEQALEPVRPGCHENAGKLTPAMAEHFRGQSVEAVESFLKKASRVMPGERVQPQTATSAPFKTNGEGRVTNAEGKTLEELLPQARVALKQDDPDLYKAMYEDWNAHGRIPGIVAETPVRA